MVEVIDAKSSMAIDAAWIEQLSSLTEIRMRAYEWQTKSITYGYFIKPEQYLDCQKAEACGFTLAKRPTGGGMLFHYHDFSYTVAVPCHHKAYSKNVIDNYRFVNSALLKALAQLAPSLSLYDETTPKSYLSHFCMATPTKYDLIASGKKIGGAAQRKTKWGFLHQGSLFLIPPNWQELRLFVYNPEEAISQMQSNMTALFPEAFSLDELQRVRLELKRLFLANLQS